MSNVANWSYTASATVWHTLGKDEHGDPLGYSAPEIILCDYEGGLSKKIVGVSAALGSLGSEVVVKNTFWTEYAEAKAGDYLLIGESALADPLEAGADELLQVIRYADTFERTADDYALLTGV
jgi:predicted cupin superfamily sugar epimerase